MRLEAPLMLLVVLLLLSLYALSYSAVAGGEGLSMRYCVLLPPQLPRQSDIAKLI